MYDKNMGISVYLGIKSLDEDIKYIKMAHKYGFTKIFTCFLGLNEENKNSYLESLSLFMNIATNLNFKVYVDVNPYVLKLLNITYEDLSFFKNLNIYGIRLDEGFSGLEESAMSFQSNLKIMINASNGTKYLDNIISYKPNMSNLEACHNFYPRKYSGLSLNHFLQTSQDIKNYGLSVGAFVNSQNSDTFSNQEIMEGLPSLEHHRNIPLVNQAKELYYCRLINDVMIGNAYASESEFKQLYNLDKNLITLDAQLEDNLESFYTDMLLNNLHTNRGDVSDFIIRSTMLRIKYKNTYIPPFNTKNIQAGDITIDNENYKKYKGELHIARAPMINDGNVNVIGKINQYDLGLLNYIKPWSKFNFNLINK